MKSEALIKSCELGSEDIIEFLLESDKIKDVINAKNELVNLFFFYQEITPKISQYFFIFT